MAMYTKQNGWVNSIESKTDKNGLEYSIVKICIQSKRKDENGNYTIYENPCFIYAKAFFKNVLEKLLIYDLSLLIEFNLKLESGKKDDNHYQNWALLDIEIVDSVMVTEPRINDSDRAEEIAKKRQIIHDEIAESIKIMSENNAKVHPVVC